jgi:hypothetical protein
MTEAGAGMGQFKREAKVMILFPLIVVLFGLLVGMLAPALFE